MSFTVTPDFLWQVLALLFVHWVADFCLQTDWQAQNKSKNNSALAAHVGIYSLCLWGFALLFLGASGALAFAVVNGWLHFATDYCTSRWSSALYQKGDRHNFFVVVGLDQFIHQATLLLTWGAFQ